MPAPLRHPKALLLATAGLLIVLWPLVDLPEIQAERVIARSALDAMPIQERHLALVRAQLSLPHVRQTAHDAVSLATQRAAHTALAQSELDAFARVRHALHRQDYDRARSLARALDERFLALPDTPETRQKLAKISLLLGRISLLQGRPTQAIRALEKMPKDTPVEDYRLWMLTTAYQNQNAWEKALQAADALGALPQSPMYHRAKVKRAHLLFEADRWEEAALALEAINTTYPDYPRRHLSLLQHAQALEAMGNLQLAATAYQKAWFDFPYKKTAATALDRLGALAKQGHTPPPLTYQQRYDRSRLLRINKHWDLARAMFLELESSIDWTNPIEARTQQSEIWLQLALNAYIPKRYEEALHYLEKLKASYESGWRRGISRYMLYTYLATVQAKFGDLETALKNLDLAYLSLRDRRQARATFLAEHGRYKAAIAIESDLRSAGQKRGWSYTWLLYKSGQFDDARKNFLAIAAATRGRSRARALYWAARTAERQGDLPQAKAEFQALLDDFKTNYYAIQAKNRLWDLEHPVAPPSTLIASEADRLGNAHLHAMDQSFQAPAPKTKADRWARAMALDRSRQRTQLRADLDLEQNRALEPILCPLDGSGESTLCALARHLEDAPISHHSQTPVLRPPALEHALAPFPPVPSTADFAPRQRPKLSSRDHKAHGRPESYAPARIFWTGQGPHAAADLQRYDAGQTIGPVPETYEAYGGEETYRGGLGRMISRWGQHFPELERARWLHQTGMDKEARWAVRDVALEYRELSRLSLPSSKPHQLSATRMSPLIDNRRSKKSTWGYVEDQYRWPIASDAPTKKAQLERQRAIILAKHTMRDDLIDALKEVGDYYMVRRLTLEKGIRGSAQRRRDAYPRAFPELVIPQSLKWGVNPYLIWALMTVESSYNPDSVSTAEALGLLQVIPRTGLKNAELLGDDDFGHYDLLDEDVAIRHGVFYFAQLVRKFRGQELFAMAGYNGGPHRVAEWIDMRGDMPMDEFVEEIPYDQAREYTKKVSRFLHMYLRIYENQNTLYIGQHVDRSWLTMPNF